MIIVNLFVSIERCQNLNMVKKLKVHAKMSFKLTEIFLKI